ncbi:MAG: hypothetical protein IV100_19035 [Myxococcales bacterium]|nr:hypothetical protein [Myxococcales bacterium]
MNRPTSRLRRAPYALLIGLCSVTSFGCSDDTTAAPSTADGSDATDAADATDGSDAADAVDATDGADATDGLDGSDATDGTDGADGSDGAEAVTYHGHVRALVEQACGQCHESGGIGPFPLDTYGALTGAADAVKGAVDADRMPPWQLDPECHPMAGERLLTPDDKAMLLGWLAGERPEGDPKDYSPRGTDLPVVGEPTLVLDAGVDYTPIKTLPDDYRCLLLTKSFDEATYITGFDVAPDNRPIVHHVLLYLAMDSDMAEMEALDKEDAAPGWPCFGGPRAGSNETLGGWVPGSVGFHLPADMAIEVPAGGRIIMQLHYNTQGAAEPPADRTQALLWTLPSGQKPASVVDIFPVAQTDLAIQPGDANSVQTLEMSLPISGTIIGVTPHMHTLGKSLKASVVRQDGSEQCLSHVPDWDFNWQQFYLYAPGNYIDVLPGEKVKLECVYDNSAANQPYVNGEQASPKLVTWGEGTRDEMCLNYVIVKRPYLEDDGSKTCPGFKGCQLACDPGDVMCLLQCSYYAGLDCFGCVLDAVSPCAQANCPAEGLGVVTCMNGCEGDQLGCLVTDCRPQLDTLYACLEPAIESGICDDALEQCDVRYGAE